MSAGHSSPAAACRLPLTRVGFEPGPVASLRVWWARRQPRSTLLPDAPGCLGWKRNRAAGLKGTGSSYPALFCGQPPRFEGDSVWVAAEGRWARGVLSARSPGGGGGQGEGLSREKGRTRKTREAGGRGVSWGLRVRQSEPYFWVSQGRASGRSEQIRPPGQKIKS